MYSVGAFVETMNRAQHHKLPLFKAARRKLEKFVEKFNKSALTISSDENINGSSVCEGSEVIQVTTV